MSYGYIYLIKDHFTNKVYIGRRKGHESKSLNYFGSGKIIHNILHKRKHHLSKIVLGYCESKEELINLETQCIEFFNATNKLYGYNLKSTGNDGGAIRFGPHSEQSKQKMRKPKSKQARRNMKLAQNKNIKLKQLNSKLLWSTTTYRYQQTKALQKSWDEHPERKKQFSKIFSGKNNPANIKIDTQQILKLYNSGISMRKLSKMFNCTHPTISKRIKNPEKYL